jgi:branched chain amino acid efflux pump
MTLHAATLVAIIGMALATYATRVSGLYLLRVVNVRGRTKAALDALPPAILMAVIAPTITSGWAEAGAALITAVAAVARLPLIVVLLIGIGSVVALRFVLT